MERKDSTPLTTDSGWEYDLTVFLILNTLA